MYFGGSVTLKVMLHITVYSILSFSLEEEYYVELRVVVFFGSKIGLGFGLFGPKNGLFGHFLGLFGLNIGYYGKNGQMGLLLSSAAEYTFSHYVCVYGGTLGYCEPLDQALVTHFFQLYLYMGNI